MISHFMDNLRQLIYVLCVTGILTIQIYGLWRLLCFAFGWDYDEEESDDE